MEGVGEVEGGEEVAAGTYGAQPPVVLSGPPTRTCALAVAAVARADGDTGDAAVVTGATDGRPRLVQLHVESHGRRVRVARLERRVRRVLRLLDERAAAHGVAAAVVRAALRDAVGHPPGGGGDGGFGGGDGGETAGHGFLGAVFW